jgi:hypothetical protein
MHTVSHPGSGTLLYREFEALDLVDASEARFLASAVRDAVREAQRHGAFEANFHRYRLRAWRESLGSRLVTVTSRVSNRPCTSASRSSVRVDTAANCPRPSFSASNLFSANSLASCSTILICAGRSA